MAQIGQLSVKITADNKGVKQGLDETGRAVDKTSSKANQGSQAWAKYGKALALAAAVAAAFAIKEATQLSNAFTDITNKLKLASNGTEDLKRVTQKLFDVSNESRSGIEATAELYAKLERSTRSLNIGQDRLLNITGSITKAFAISGASTQEASGAIRQLGQAMASGALRGDEFNSIAEGAPIILEAISAATGKNAGELRKLAAEGAITSDVLIKSLEAYKAKIDGDFSTATVTWDQKLEIARNNAIKNIGANQGLAAAISLIGDAMVEMSESTESTDSMITGLARKFVFLGDMIRVVQLAFKGIEIAFVGVATLMATVFEGIFTVITSFGNAIKDGILQPIISLLEIAKDIPGVGDTFAKIGDNIERFSKSITLKVPQTVKNFSAAMTEAASLATDEFKALAEKELPTTAFDRLIEEAKSKIIAAKEEVSGGGADAPIIDLEAEAKKAKNAELLILLKERLKSETQIANESFARDKDLLLGSFADINNLTAEENANKEALEQAHQDRLSEIKAQNGGDAFLEELKQRFASQTELEAIFHEEDMLRLQQTFLDKNNLTASELELQRQLVTEHEEELTRIKQQEEDIKAAILSDALNGYTDLLALGGAKAQKIAKKLAIVNAILAGKQAAIQAWRSGMETGGPWAPLVAAGYTAASIAKTTSMISAIKGGGSSNGGGGGGVKVPSTPTGSPGGNSQQQTPQASRNINVRFIGEGLLNTSQVRALMNQINEQSGNGVNLVAVGG